MKFLKVDEESGKVVSIHHQPFDSKNGLGLEREELLNLGHLEPALPNRPIVGRGKVAELYVNPLRWEIVEVPLTKEEKLEEMLEEGRITEEEFTQLLR